jgi:hypothetical protein
MKWWNPKNKRGAERVRTKATLTMLNVVDRANRRRILETECAVVAKQALEFYLWEKDKLGVDGAIDALKVQPFVENAKDKTKHRQIARRRAVTV